MKNFRPADLSRSASWQSDKFPINYIVLHNPCFIVLFGGSSRKYPRTESVFASNLFNAGFLWEFHKPIAHRILSFNKQNKEIIYSKQMTD